MSGILRPPECHYTGCACHSHSFLWLSEKYQYLWLEIPKCGSTTLKSWLPDKKRIPYAKFSQWSHLPCLCIVRNPWHKIVSCFYQWNTSRVGILRSQFNCATIQFNEFVNDLGNIRNHHYATCTSFLPHKHGRLQRQNLYIGRLETFVHDVAAFCQICRIPQKPISCQNSTSIRNWLAYYDKTTADQISRLFADDIQNFGYSLTA